MLVPPLTLVSLGLLFGFAPTLVDPLLGAAAQAIAPGFDAATVNAAYEWWHVVEAMLGALLLGGAILFFWARLGRLLDHARPLHRFGPEAWYRFVLDQLPHLAAWQTRRLQHGRLPHYLLLVVGGTTLGVAGLLLVARPDWHWPAAATLTLPVLAACALISAGALAAMFVRDHLVLLLVSGLVGYGSAILFLFTGAPDLAFTQFAVETVFVVVAAAVLRKVRRMPGVQHPAPAAGGAPLARGVAIAFGALMAALLLLAAGLPFDPSVGEFFAAQSLPAAHGRNVVNIILVDFRALDTLGEIAVLAFALLAALPLLGLARGSKS